MNEVLSRNMTRKELRERQRYLEKANSKYTDRMVVIPKDQWPLDISNNLVERIRVLRNNKFLVQIFSEKTSIRISVSRTELGKDGKWSENISWDDLQLIKHKIGFGDRMAVEIYPMDIDVVNVANMRHLWILNDDLDIGWKCFHG